MATQKMILDTRRKRLDGQFPVIQRIYVKSKYISRATGINISRGEWDKKKQRVKSNNPNYEKLNRWIDELRIEVETLLLQPDHYRTSDIKKLKKNLFGIDHAKSSFFEFARGIINDLEHSGRIGNARAYRDAINKLQAYTSGKHLSFEDINYEFLYQFEKHALNQGLKLNSIGSYMRSIRAIYNLGIKHGIIHDSFYPFKTYRIKTEKTKNKTLTPEELKLLYEKLKLEYLNDRYLSIFFISFTLIGISFMDLVLAKRDDVDNGRFIYKRRKTGKIYNIKVPEITFQLIECITSVKSKGLFFVPLFFDDADDNIMYDRAKNKIGYFNRRLKQISKEVGINKPISSYYARYSWANIAKEVGIHKDVISEALGHEYGNKVTGIYLDNYKSEEIDQANEKVLMKVFGKEC